MAPGRLAVLTSGLVAASLAGFAYLGTLHAPLVYDDRLTVVANASLREPSNVGALLLHSRFRPVANVSYALDYAVWGLTPFGYHLANVLLHMANVVLVALVAACAVRDRARDHAFSTPGTSSEVVAFTGAALFAVHPVMTEAVAYVSGRTEVLCATFFLSALLALRAAIVGSRAWLVPGAAAAALALGTKEIAAALPLVLLLWDRLLIGGDPERARRRLVGLHLPLIALVAAAGIARMLVFLGEPAGATSPGRYLAVQPVAWWRYLGLLAVPAGQSIVHRVEPPALVIGLAAVALAAAAITLVWWRRRMPVLALGAAWFALVLGPSSIVPLTETMAEHRVYLASVGLFVAVGTLAGTAFARLAVRGARWRVATRAVAAATLVGLFTLTVARNALWADPVALWTDAARKAPQVWRAHFGLGNALAEAGRCGEAIDAFRDTVRLAFEAQALLNMATCLAAERRVEEARRMYQRLLTVEPRYAPAHYNLALLALSHGQRDVAHRHFLSAVTAEPEDAAWRQFLLAAHAGRVADRALHVELCRAIARVAPGTPGVADCLAAEGRR
jgi:hypothetical protein